MEKQLQVSVIEYLLQLQNADSLSMDKENIEVGCQCLSEAFQIDSAQISQTKQTLQLHQFTLTDIFQAGLASLNISTPNQQQQPSELDDPVVKQNPELWKKWIDKLEGRGFFKGTTVDSQEYNDRRLKALEKFKEKFSKKTEDSTPALSKEESEAKAEEIKGKGNAAIAAKNFEQAVDFYLEAIKLSPRGPKSHVYYANLAAAEMHLKHYNSVIDNCEKAIELMPSYVKAYSRLGAAHFWSNDYDAAIESYRRGLEVDPSNAACKDGLAEAEAKKNMSSPQPSSGNSSAPTGLPDFSNLASMFGGAGGAGGAGGLAGMMNNPGFAQMAQSVMQNPEMMQMAQNMMQNPEMMQNMMGQMGGLGGGTGASAAAAAPPAGSSTPSSSSTPDFQRFLTPEGIEMFKNHPETQAMRNDPDMAGFFRDLDSGGPSAAISHMSNPAVSQKLQALMSRIQ